MAKKININGDLNDVFYRYKMPEVIVRQQGAFYAFLNIDDVCAEKGGINRPLTDVQKFLNKNLHTSFTYKNKSLITSAPITKDIIQNTIFDYINKFILCGKCSSPETIINKIKNKSYNACSACGNLDEISVNGIVITIKKKENIKIQKTNEIIKVVKTEKTNEIIKSEKTTEIIKVVKTEKTIEIVKPIKTNQELEKTNQKLKKIDQELEDLINNI